MDKTVEEQRVQKNRLKGQNGTKLPFPLKFSECRNKPLLSRSPMSTPAAASSRTAGSGRIISEMPSLLTITARSTRLLHSQELQHNIPRLQREQSPALHCVLINQDVVLLAEGCKMSKHQENSPKLFPNYALRYYRPASKMYQILLYMIVILLDKEDR